jgi:hypothetical protein
VCDSSGHALALSRAALLRSSYSRWGCVAGSDWLDSGLNDDANLSRRSKSSTIEYRTAWVKTMLNGKNGVCKIALSRSQLTVENAAEE